MVSSLLKVISLKRLFTASVQQANFKFERHCGVKEHILSPKCRKVEKIPLTPVLSLISKPDRGRCIRLASLQCWYLTPVASNNKNKEWFLDIKEKRAFSSSLAECEPFLQTCHCWKETTRKVWLFAYVFSFPGSLALDYCAPVWEDKRHIKTATLFSSFNFFIIEVDAGERAWWPCSMALSDDVDGRVNHQWIRGDGCEWNTCVSPDIRCGPHASSVPSGEFGPWTQTQDIHRWDDGREAHLSTEKVTVKGHSKSLHRLSRSAHVKDHL